MQLFLRKAGVAGGKPYLVYAFNMVFLSKIDWSAGSDDEQPIERLRLRTKPRNRILSAEA